MNSPNDWKTDPKVLLADKAANWCITIGGLSVIAAVLGIFVFILVTVWPMFQEASLGDAASLKAGGAVAGAFVDEHQEKLVLVRRDGSAAFLDIQTQALTEAGRLAPAGAVVSSAALGEWTALQGLGLKDGRLSLAELGVETSFVGDQRVKAPYMKAATTVLLDRKRRPLQRLALSGSSSQAAAAAQVAPRSFVFAPLALEGERWSLGRPAEQALPEGSGALSALLVHSGGERVLAGTDKGHVFDYRYAEGKLSPFQTTEALPEGEAATALGYTIGEHSVLVGGAKGSVASLILLETGDTPQYLRIHQFEPLRAAVQSFAASQRDRTFIALASDGSLRGYFLTAERTLFNTSVPPSLLPAALRLAPKGDGFLLVGSQDQALLTPLRNLHPEVTWRTLFGKVWYEGYEGPEYVWQSTGGSDDFESKFSLTPLIYGTFKGTFYALLFAVPLAILGAIYTSQFMSRGLRSVVKPMVELMAALPSVVLGFLAALLLAPMIERHLFSILMGALTLPIFVMASLLAWRAAPRSWTRKLPQEAEILVLVAGMALGFALVAFSAPAVETALFYDFKVWMSRQLGVNYDQRNSLVVGFAMGFAVIPIIYTICEDSLSSVPKHLTSASLSSGATLWQTAIQVVLPVALSGIFSAVMVGFGRAVGETMIVLMATGNTPVMDMSPFNGFRALSANIAVEIPEAPVNGTLYRTLFFAGLLLFLVTFAVNTVAELIRLHLRRKYSQL